MTKHDCTTNLGRLAACSTCYERPDYNAAFVTTHDSSNQLFRPEHKRSWLAEQQTLRLWRPTAAFPNRHAHKGLPYTDPLSAEILHHRTDVERERAPGVVQTPQIVKSCAIRHRRCDVLTKLQACSLLSASMGLRVLTSKQVRGCRHHLLGTYAAFSAEVCPAHTVL